MIIILEKSRLFLIPKLNCMYRGSSWMLNKGITVYVLNYWSIFFWVRIFSETYADNRKYELIFVKSSIITRG